MNPVTWVRIPVPVDNNVLKGVDEVVMLAGKDYQVAWMTDVIENDWKIKITRPLQGLRQGEQLQWLNRKIR